MILFLLTLLRYVSRRDCSFPQSSCGLKLFLIVFYFLSNSTGEFNTELQAALVGQENLCYALLSSSD